MANKKSGDRQNKRQRRELAQTQRLTMQRRLARQRMMRRLGTGAVALIVIAGIAFLVVNNSHKNKAAQKQLDTLAAAAGCSTIEHPPDQGRQHLQADETFNYKGNPPTSGNHDPSPANTGVHTEPIPDRNQVHNLEHGHIGIQFNNVDSSLETALEAVVRSNDTRIFMAPRPTLDAKLALTAWDTRIKCQNPNQQATDLARAFAKQYAGKGPEGDLPGQPI